MATRLRYVILPVVLILMSVSCNRQERSIGKVRALYEQGVELRSQQLSEDAATCFMQALTVLQKCKATPETTLLEGQLKDNLGAMFAKHGLFDEAFTMHQEAVVCFAQIPDSVAMATAWRNSGRTAKSLGQFDTVKQCYDSAFAIANTLNDSVLLNDLYLEAGRDYYMATRRCDTAILFVNRAIKGGLSDSDLDIANMTLGILYYYTHDYDTAKTHLHAALRSDRPGLKMSVYQTLYAIAYNEGDYALAVDYQDLFTENMMLSDKEHDSEVMQRLKADYELRRHEADMMSQQRHHNLKLYLMIALAVIVLLVALLIANRRMAAKRLEVEQLKNRQEHDQSRIRQLVSEMENLVHANDELMRDRETLSQNELQTAQQVMQRNRVYATAKALSERITSEALNFALTDGDWDDFINLTDLAYGGFSKRLLALYPKMGKWDVRICCLSKNGFSNQVISILLDTQTDSYYKRKTRIKQNKMNLGDDNRSFEEIINDI